MGWVQTVHLKQMSVLGSLITDSKMPERRAPTPGFLFYRGVHYAKVSVKREWTVHVIMAT